MIAVISKCLLCKARHFICMIYCVWLSPIFTLMRGLQLRNCMLGNGRAEVQYQVGVLSSSTSQSYLDKYYFSFIYDEIKTRDQDNGLDDSVPGSQPSKLS